VGASFSLSESEEGSGPSDCRGSVGSDGIGGGAIASVDTTRRMIRERSLPRVRATVGETVWMVDPKRNLRVRGSGVSGL
jgi:hypothetical protein